MHIYMHTFKQFAKCVDAIHTYKHEHIHTYIHTYIQLAKCVEAFALSEESAHSRQPLIDEVSMHVCVCMYVCMYVCM